MRECTNNSCGIFNCFFINIIKQYYSFTSERRRRFNSPTNDSHMCYRVKSQNSLLTSFQHIDIDILRGTNKLALIWDEEERYEIAHRSFNCCPCLRSHAVPYRLILGHTFKKLRNGLNDMHVCLVEIVSYFCCVV